MYVGRHCFLESYLCNYVTRSTSSSSTHLSCQAKNIPPYNVAATFFLPHILFSFHSPLFTVAKRPRERRSTFIRAKNLFDHHGRKTAVGEKKERRNNEEEEKCGRVYEPRFLTTTGQSGLLPKDDVWLLKAAGEEQRENESDFGLGRRATTAPIKEGERSEGGESSLD